MLNWAMILIVALQAPPPNTLYTYSIDLFRSNPEAPYTFSIWSLSLVSRTPLEKKGRPFPPAWSCLACEPECLAGLAGIAQLLVSATLSPGCLFRPLLLHLPTLTAAAGHQPLGQHH